MLIMDVILELRKLIREKKEEEKYRAQLMKMPLNYDLLEHLANKYKDRKITIQIEGNNSITIEPRIDINENKYKSFRDRYKEAHS